ncbi:hypothetical protein C8R44DRAFT_723817 [Mycena epipterygia]|nr:hypothetical protein C8R44DRAFT_723817 [Mycena epipterygia]
MGKSLVLLSLDPPSLSQKLIPHVILSAHGLSTRRGFGQEITDRAQRALTKSQEITDRAQRPFMKSSQVMVPPSLLFASYWAEISFDLNISSVTLPGIAIAGKLVVAQISEELVILMAGIIGHEEPLLSLMDWSKIKIEVEAAGTVEHPQRYSMQNCQPSVFLRIALEDQAAFWAFAYLMVKPSYTFARELVFSLENQQHITEMFEFFKNDHGQEFPGGEGTINVVENQDLPGYDAISTVIKSSQGVLIYFFLCGLITISLFASFRVSTV